MFENEDRKYSIEKFSQLTHNLLEANNYGQFASDFNQPLAQCIRDDIRSIVEYLPGIEHILKMNPSDEEEWGPFAIALTDEEFFEDYIDHHLEEYEKMLASEYQDQEHAIDSMVGIEHYVHGENPCQVSDNAIVTAVTPKS